MRRASAELGGRYEAEVASALGAVDVRPPGSFLWFGRRSWVPTSHDDALDREILVDRLQQQLYRDFYGTGTPRPQAEGPVMPAGDNSDFLRALSQANCGRGAWQAGWCVATVDEDTIAVARPDGLRLLAPEDDCRVDGVAAPGTQATVRVPKELLGFSPGFYIALGDTPPPVAYADRLRLCWNLAAAGAVTLVARVTYALNGAGVPFSLELLDDPARYGRREAAALLLARTDFPVAIKLLRPLLRALGPHLADAAPAFTKPLARGLALAEEPGDGRSFGDDRCRLLADAIVSASEQRLRGAEQRLAVVRERFQAAGITLHAPYLEPGSADAYELS